MERKKKIIVAVAAVLVLMVGLMAWKKSETKLSGRYKTDQSTQYIYMLPESFIYVHIIVAMIIMIPLFYIVIGKTRLSGD